MKRKISFILLFCVLLSAAVLPAAAYTRISYGVDHFSDRAELIKTALHGDTFRFSETDFKQALGVSDIKNVTILSIPAVTVGSLCLDGTPVVAGQILRAGELKGLTFVPKSADMADTTFDFCANTGAGTTALTCILRTVERVNYAPTVVTLTEADLAVSTKTGIGIMGEMKAEDPEGDALTYLILSYPEKGNLTLLDSESGAYRYVPTGHASGEDSFSYVARDAYGNYSTVATVKIAVSARGDTPVYADMGEHAAHHAALCLYEKNIMQGKLEGDGMYFHPDEGVTRGEFLVMAMKAAGVSPAAGVKQTWFDDDDKIPASIKNYVATAQLYGYVNGSFDGAGLYFAPDRAITRGEAAVMLHRLLGTEAPAVLPTVTDAGDIPAWASEAMYALYGANILPLSEEGGMAAESPLTRGEAAMTLYGAMA